MRTIDLPVEIMGADGTQTKQLVLRDATCGDFLAQLSATVPLLLPGTQIASAGFGFDFARRLSGVAPGVAAKWPPAVFSIIADAGLEEAAPFLGT